jgi:hypothetical protein
MQDHTQAIVSVVDLLRLKVQFLRLGAEIVGIGHGGTPN